MNPIVSPVIPEKLIAFLHAHNTFIIAGHKEPDGDCIGSSLALSFFLRRLGKDTILMSAGPFKQPEIVMYEPFFLTNLPPHTQHAHTETAVIIVDCSDIQRTGSLASQLTPFSYTIIDHHTTNSIKMPHSLVYPDAPSTTYIIQALIEEVAGSVTREEAEMLFFGLCTDTGFFRHLDTRSADIFNAASRLIKAGVSPKYMFAKINGGKSLHSRLLISRILSRMQCYYEGKLILSYETLQDKNELGMEGRDSDTLYQLIQSIRGVQATCIIRQDTETHCSVGFRSLDTVDVSIIASSFGGGGHKHASGLYIEGTINSLMPQFVKAFGPQLDSNT